MPNQFTRPWTPQELQFLEQQICKLTYKQMGEIIQRTPASIQSKVRFLPFQQKVKKHSVNSHFFKQWSADMSYVLGFIAADGNICHSGRAHVLHVASDDQDIIEKIKLTMDYKGPIHQKQRLNGKISYSLRICDPIIFSDLQLLNITERKSLTIKPPHIPPPFKKDFVRGFFDGDGSISLVNHKYPSKIHVLFYTASLDMAIFLHQFLSEILGSNYKGRICTRLAHQKTPFYILSTGHSGGVKLFNYMYNDRNLYMERKYKKFIEGMSQND